MNEPAENKRLLRILIDVDVIADVIQKKSPNYTTSSALMSKVLVREIIGVLPGFAPVSIHQMVSEVSDPEQANDIVDWLLANFEIAPLEKAVFFEARNAPVGDFVTAVVVHSARLAKCQYIVTRTLDNYETSPVPVLAPEEMLYELSQRGDG